MLKKQQTQGICLKTEREGADKICISDECTLDNSYICQECEEAHEHSGSIIAVRVPKVKNIHEKTKMMRESLQLQKQKLHKLNKEFNDYVQNWQSEIESKINTCCHIDEKLSQFWEGGLKFTGIWEILKKQTNQIENVSKINRDSKIIEGISTIVDKIVQGQDLSSNIKAEVHSKNQQNSLFLNDFVQIFSYLPISMSGKPRKQLNNKIMSLKADTRSQLRCLERLYELTSNYEKALSINNKLLQQNSLDTEILNRRATVYKSLNLLEEAYDDYSLLIGLLDGKMNLEVHYFQRAEIEKKMGKYIQAIRDYEQVQSKGFSFLNDYEIQRSIGFCYEKIKNYKEAIDIYERIFRQLKKEQMGTIGKEVLHSLVQCTRNTREFDKTLQYLNELLVLEEGNVSIILQRAALCHSLQQYERAYLDYSTVLKSIHDNPNIYYNRGIELIYMKREKEAVQDLLKAIQLNPNFKQAAVLLANTTYELTLGEQKEKYFPISVDAYRLCTKLIPDGEGIWHNLGLLLTEKFAEEAHHAFSQAIQINKNQASSYLGRIKTSLALNSPAETILKDIHKLLELGNKTSHVLYLKSVMEEQLEKYEQALKSIELVLAVEPERIGVLQSKVRIKVKAKITDGLEKDLEQLERIDRMKAQKYRELNN